jgi:hypothetical protein
MKLTVSPFKALKKGSVGFSRFHVCIVVHLGKFIADPYIQGSLSLDNCHTSWVEGLVSISSLVKILGHKLANDALWIVLLMAHEAENARVYSEGKEIWVNKAFLPPHELLDECHVGIDTCAAFFDALVAHCISDSLSEHHICNTNRCRTRNSLYAVHKYFTSCRFGITNKLNSVVEDAGDVFAGMVLQVVALVTDPL